MESFRQVFNSSFCLPFGKADDTPSAVLERARGSLTTASPFPSCIWGILDFRSYEVQLRPLKNVLSEIFMEYPGDVSLAINLVRRISDFAD
jgi:hypothetical protein